MPATVVRAPGREGHHLVADAHDARGDLAGVPAVVAVRVVARRTLRADDELHRQSEATRAPGRPTAAAPRAARAGWARRTRACAAERSTTLSPSRALTPGWRSASAMPSSRADGLHLGRDPLVDLLAKSTRSILLTATTTCGTRSSAATARWRRVCSSTPLRASTRSTTTSAVRRAGDRVAGVLHVAGAVGEHERALGRREVAVGDVDRDALLALGAQAVGEQREVGGAPGRGRG